MLTRLVPVTAALLCSACEGNNTARDTHGPEQFVFDTLEEQGLDIIDGANEIMVVRTRTDAQGRTHIRFAQIHDGVPVVGRGGILHLEADGRFRSLTDTVERNLELSTTAQVSSEQALATAASHPSSGGIGADVARVELGIVLLSDSPSLVYTVDFPYDAARRGMVTPRVLVDAQHGTVVAAHDRAPAALDREIYDLNGATVTPSTPDSLALLPGQLELSEGGPTNSDPDVMDAYINAGIAYDCFERNFGLDSFDGNGGTIVVSVNNNFPNNGFWEADSHQMVLGDGDGTTYSSIAEGMDFVIHEYAHGMTHYWVSPDRGLWFPSEAADIDEHISDAMAATCEEWYKFFVPSYPGDPFELFDLIYTPNISDDASRYMYDPALGGDEDYYGSRTMSPHANAGVGNLAFYLVSQGGQHPNPPPHAVPIQVQGVGTINAGLIWQKAVIDYMSSNEDWEMWRFSTEQAVIDLYGSRSPHYKAVMDAWDAVGVPQAF